MSRAKKRKIKYICLIAVLLIGVGVAAAWGIMHFDQNEYSPKEETLPQKEEVQNASYISDTNYGSFGPIDKEVFAYPFRKSNQYVANKDFIDNFTDEEIEEIIRDGNVFLQSLFNGSFRDVIGDEQGFKEHICDQFAADYLMVGNDEEISTRSFADQVATWYAENHVKIEMKSESNGALVWKDNYLYVRYLLTLTLYSCENADFLENLIGYPLKVGEARKFVIDLALADTGEQYKIAAWNLMGNYSFNE